MKIEDTRKAFLDGRMVKPDFIRNMFEQHHVKLFEYADYLKQTNIAAIEILDGRVVMISRDRGVKMICPSGDHRVAPIEILNFLGYEPVDSEMMMKLMTPGRCVLDIGANAGWYAINMAKAYPSCTIHAFEPISDTHQMLLRNIRLNEMKNVVAHHLGFSDEEKDVVFFFYPEGSANASSANLSGREDAKKIVCHVETLDAFADRLDLPQVGFIKCDVEGAELFVFRGGMKLLERDKPVVFSEMLRKWSAKFNYHPNDIIRLFTGLGYRCFTAKGGRLTEFFSMDENTVETNFFFLHSARHLEMIRSLT
jgi:FkbM family methyltransferase